MDPLQVFTQEDLEAAKKAAQKEVDAVKEAAEQRERSLQERIDQQQQRIDHQQQRIERVAFEYERAFGRDALFCAAFPERAPGLTRRRRREDGGETWSS
jgi:hypothetical protein